MSDQRYSKEDVFNLHFQEGPMENYFESFQNEFGGSWEKNHYWADNDQVQFNAQRHELAESLDMSVLSFESKKKIISLREPDNNPDLLHLNIVSKGAYRQAFTDQKVTVDHQTNRGAFLYNSLFPISVDFEADRRINMVFFKFHKSRLGTMFGDSAAAFGELFQNDEPLYYHSPVGHRTNRLISDLFVVNEATFDREALLVARGMELFSIMTASFKSLKNKDSLHGLHPEDFNRLQRVKGELLSDFEQKTSITDLAKRHGVSISKLKRDFKSLFGMSVYKFYNHSRMDEAYRRLNSGQFTVTEVGYDLGYSNLSKFSEMFKRIKGISPRQALP